MKYNPFRPNGIISPGIFHGRIAEIQQIERGLFQAKNGNPVHFMIQGERGIGKSSLFFVIALTASGDLETTSGEKLNFLVVSLDLGGASTQLDIVRAIGRELRSEIDSRSKLKEKAKNFWEWASKWEVLGIRYHREKDLLNPEDAVDELVSNISSLCTQLGDEIDGILFLIDEADRPNSEANLGELCKLITERLYKKNCNNVAIGLAGLPTLIQKLRDSHESSPRLFTTMLLEPLLPEEIELVLHSGIDQANNKNTVETSINPEAVSLLSSLSEGYPHFIQQFAYSAFEHDSDNVIGREDVIEGAYSENGALSQLGDKYFSNMYHSKIASNDYRRVLDTMAAHGDNWVTRKEIISESGLSGHTVTNALNALKGREIIVSDESRKNRGYYRLPTRSFATWINAIKSVSASSNSELKDLFAPSNEV
ncbi:ATP-binding protein [Nitratireductor aquimarinus]|uniref:ATP-binding protein n=1 Tax=Nitratireductor aquimarinus TaxID=889300 RepID=UPI001A8D4703|nr:ATP-binding protein [Nitratireductor aquimarinus]MBN8242929.1 ATP-binding protein [Nitratireductor aquimarinus]MBY6132030.1 ATP-binding protein [Nitratireductor aquimarinus]MCA1301566.1 ATP-binding protein [Nitratireductor aquimarinus]